MPDIEEPKRDDNVPSQEGHDANHNEPRKPTADSDHLSSFEHGVSHTAGQGPFAELLRWALKASAKLKAEVKEWVAEQRAAAAQNQAADGTLANGYTGPAQGNVLPMNQGGARPDVAAGEKRRIPDPGSPPPRTIPRRRESAAEPLLARDRGRSQERQPEQRVQRLRSPAGSDRSPSLTRRGRGRA